MNKEKEWKLHYLFRFLKNKDLRKYLSSPKVYLSYHNSLREKKYLGQKAKFRNKSLICNMAKT